MSQELG